MRFSTCRRDKRLVSLAHLGVCFAIPAQGEGGVIRLIPQSIGCRQRALKKLVEIQGNDGGEVAHHPSWDVCTTKVLTAKAAATHWGSLPAFGSMEKFPLESPRGRARFSEIHPFGFLSQFADFCRGELESAAKSGKERPDRTGVNRGGVVVSFSR